MPNEKASTSPAQPTEPNQTEQRKLPESDTLRLLIQRYGDPNAKDNTQSASQQVTTEQPLPQQPSMPQQQLASPQTFSPTAASAQFPNQGEVPPQVPPQGMMPESTPEPPKKKTGWIVAIVVAIVVVALVAIGLALGFGSDSDGSTTSVTQQTQTVAEPEPEPEPESEPVDKVTLEKRLDGAAILKAEDYTDESWAALQSAVKQGQAVYDNPDATQEEVDAAAIELYSTLNAMEMRQPVPEDYQWIPYNDMARNPDSYKGQLLAYSGKVVQLLEDSSEVNIRLAVDDDYDQMLYVYYDPSIIDYRVLEGDYITVYGECQGLYTYETIFGGSVTIPLLFGQIIELQS